MTATITTIKNHLTDLVEGYTPTVRSGVKFRRSLGTEPLEKMIKGSRFDRSFEWVAAGPVPSKNWGGSAHECDTKMELHVGYMGRQDDRELADRIDADTETITKYLFQSGQSWPDALRNIVPDGDPRTVPAVAEGNNVLVRVIPYRVTYDI